MDLRKITPDFAVSPQIGVGDIHEIKAAGYQAIICNRPDGEDVGQPSFEDIEAAATVQGLKAFYIPVQAGMVTDKNVADFGKALDAMIGPALAYCRSGTRCAALWSLNAARNHSTEDILAATRSAGYDLSGLADRIANAAKSQSD